MCIMKGSEGVDKEIEELKKEYEGRELTARERYSYKRSMRRIRARYGLTDGLRCDRKEFKAYLQKRREEDAKSRPGRYFSK